MSRSNSTIMTTMLAIFALLLTTTTAMATQISLKECLELAQHNNPSLKTIGRNRAIQAEQVAIANSDYLPRLDLQAGYTAQQNPQSIKTSNGAIATQQADYASASVGAYYTLYDFGRRGSRKEQALFGEQAVDASIAAARQDIFLQVVSSYYAILQNHRLADATRAEVAQREQHLQRATIFFKEGVTTRNDLLQAEVKLAGSKQKLLSVNNRTTNSWLQLNYLTGNPPEYRATLAEEDIAGPASPDIGDAVENRAEIVAQKAVISAAESRVSESGDAFYPELFLRGGIDYLQNSKAAEQTIFSATVGLKLNLFEGLATSARLRQAVNQLEKEREKLREMEGEYRLELRMAKNDLQVARERIDVAKAAINQGEENLRINNERYLAQIGTATDVIDAQTLLTQAKSDYYQALYDFGVATARVKRAAGAL